MTSIADNVAHVKDRIAAAAARSGRDADSIRLIAVSKYIDAQTTRALVECGCLDLGESRPQELWDKARALDDLPIRWHMIGHLQRNKVRRSLPLVWLLHSGDSLRLLKTANDCAGDAGRRLPVLLEVNVSHDKSKHGFAPSDLAAHLAPIAELENLEVRGLMCMAGQETDAHGARRDFESLRQLRDRLLAECPEQISLAELSMGMSRDFEAAIEEGATMVRIGSALYC